MIAAALAEEGLSGVPIHGCHDEAVSVRESLDVRDRARYTELDLSAVVAASMERQYIHLARD